MPSGTGAISEQELRRFYNVFLEIGRLEQRVLDEATSNAYKSLSAVWITTHWWQLFTLKSIISLLQNGEYQITNDVFHLAFMNFLVGKHPNGPGQFIFGTVEQKSGKNEEQELPMTFKIDYSALEEENCEPGA